MLEWKNGNTFTPIVTLYPNNFTLNSPAGVHFQDSRYCMIGIDPVQKQVAIRPVSKQEIDQNVVNLQQLHKVSIGKGYVRISNKAVISEIASLIGKDVNGDKFAANYDVGNGMLMVDLQQKL
ncbi:MAG: hypothetical protein LBR25_01110 [Erysipelotrichaceae bacterium]|jgi:hypothetical protein|nr:hypothetical protein [Erysipelotrichaceae bacterium]